MSVSKYRAMRILLFYDLPSVEDYEKKEYRQFRKQIIKQGFIMMQYSVYYRCLNSGIKYEQEVQKLKQFLPNDGNLRILLITEKQYSEMKLILGSKKNNELYNNTKRYIKI